MEGGTSSGYVADLFGNLIPTDPASPFIDNQGYAHWPDGTVSGAPFGLSLSLPWWIYVAGAIIAYVIVKDIVR